MHAFVPRAVAPIIAEGVTIVAGVDAAGQNGHRRAPFPPPRPGDLARRDPAVVVALGLKVRQIDKRDHGRQLKEH